MNVTLHLGGKAQQPAARHDEIGLEGVAARLSSGRRRDGCRHAFHAFWGHVDAGRENDRI